jgi:hypothetical protein
MHPTWKSTLTVFLVGVFLTAISGIGQPGGYLKTAPSWIGDVGWFGSMICVLLLIVSGLWWLIWRMRQRDQPLPR